MQNVPKGVALLRAYLKNNGLRVTPWCEKVGLPRLPLTKVLSGSQKGLSIQTAFAVERATNGAIPASSWSEIEPAEVAA